MLFIVSTPIGNLEDISLRALAVLRSADVILAEDTRRTGQLLAHFKIAHKPMVSFYEEVEGEKARDLVELAASSQKVALVCDAGTPLISDPGYKLVREVISRGGVAEAIPGPTAAITALTVSGLPPDKFVFLGFLPEKAAHKINLLKCFKALIQATSLTFIVYVSVHKIGGDLRAIGDVFGDIEIVVARELTKVHQEVWRGKVSEAIIRLGKAKGEVVVLWHI